MLECFMIEKRYFALIYQLKGQQTVYTVTEIKD